MTWVNLSEYGRRRGCSSEAVKKAIVAGRLPTAARKKQNGKWEVHPEIADVEWQENTKPPQAMIAPTTRQQIPGADNPTAKEEKSNRLYDARAENEDYRAKMARLEYEKKVGLLVNAEEVRTEWLKIITEAKTKFLALPAKAKSNLPHLTKKDVAVIDSLVREILEGIAHERA